MKNLITTTVLLLSLALGALAQSSPIESVEKGLLFKRKVYKKCEIELSSPQLIHLFLNDPQMKDYYKPLALNYTASTILYSVGVALVAWPIGESLYDNLEPNWTLAYIGAGCAVLSVPFKKAFNKHAEKAVNYYNSGYKKTSAVDFDFKVGANGLGLVMKF